MPKVSENLDAIGNEGPTPRVKPDEWENRAKPDDEDFAMATEDPALFLKEVVEGFPPHQPT